jgi:hypothetical protein
MSGDAYYLNDLLLWQGTYNYIYIHMCINKYNSKNKIINNIYVYIYTGTTSEAVDFFVLDKFPRFMAQV